MYHRNRTRYEQVRRIYPVDHLAPDGGSLNHRHVRAGEGRGDGMAETSPARAHLDVQRARPWVDEPPEELAGGCAMTVCGRCVMCIDR